MINFFIKSLSNGVNLTFLIGMTLLLIYYWMKFSNYKEVKKELNDLQVELNESENEKRVEKIVSNNYKKIGKEVEAFNGTLLLKEGKYYSTIDVERYFNSVNLLEEKINMKMITSTPQLFPGIGILGTFIGLALGLSSVKTTGTSQEMLSTIQPLLDNISVAFVTSIIGILFSLISSYKLNYFLGNAEKKILELADIIHRLYPLYTNTLQGEELIKEIKEIKTTTNGLATDISKQLGEHISSQVGLKIDNLISENNKIMKTLTEDIGDKVERLTVTISDEFGDSLSGTLEKIFTEDFIGNFSKLGEDLVEVSNKNMENFENFNMTIRETILGLVEIRDNYKELNEKTSETNKEVISSLTDLTKTVSERVITVDDNLEKILLVFDKASTQVENLEISLSNSLEETSKTLEKLSGYMETNKQISDSMNKFIDSEEKILELWNGYDSKFSELNNLLFDGAHNFEQSLNASVQMYKTQLSDIRNEFSTMMGSLNQKYVEFTNKNTLDLFEEYDKHLSTAINKFNTLMGGLKEEVEELQDIIENQNEKMDNILINGNDENK